MLNNDFKVAWNVLEQILNEYTKARANHKPMNSSHEGYAVILEEVDEMWDAIKKNNIGHAKVEAVQVGAMILAFLLEVKE